MSPNGYSHGLNGSGAFWLFSWIKKKLKNPKSGYWLLVSFISFQALGFSFQRRTLRLFYSPSFGSFRPLSPEIFAVHSSHSHFCLLSAFRCTVSSSCLIVFLSVCRWTATPFPLVGIRSSFSCGITDLISSPSKDC